MRLSRFAYSDRKAWPAVCRRDCDVRCYNQWHYHVTAREPLATDADDGQPRWRHTLAAALCVFDGRACWLAV